MGVLVIPDDTRLWVVDMQYRLEGIRTAHREGFLTSFFEVHVAGPAAQSAPSPERLPCRSHGAWRAPRPVGGSGASATYGRRATPATSGR